MDAPAVIHLLGVDRTECGLPVKRGSDMLLSGLGQSATCQACLDHFVHGGIALLAQFGPRR